MNSSRLFKLTVFSILSYLFVLVYAGNTFAQISVTQDEFIKIFNPGSFHYYANGTQLQYNIGKTGGPNIYDFSSINLSNLNISNNYLVDNIPELKVRYEPSSITIGETPQTIENNPVFFVKGDSVFVLGIASVNPEYRFRHYRPYELLGKFPITYGNTFSQLITEYDTTFNSSWQVVNYSSSSSNEITTIDGFGTLKLSIGNFDCIRVKKDHSGYGDKEFMYLTKEGIFVLAGMVAATEPDTGVVTMDGAQILLHPSIVDVNEEKIIPGKFLLEQNYPNPFNPITTISYQIPTTTFVTLKIYDLLGNEVASLVNEQKSSGEYEVNFYASNLSSGIYFYQLKAGTFVQNRKMLLLK